MLTQRIVSSAAWIIFLWLLIFILPQWIFLMTVVLVVGVGLYEFFDMVSKKGISVYKYFGIITGCLIPLVTYFKIKPTAEVEFALITAVCLAVFILQFARLKTEQALVGVATTVFGIFYIGWLFSFIVKLRIYPPFHMDGRFLVAYILLVTKSGDIAAYLFGTALGRHQLIPHISPKKSIEGTVAGFLTSFLVAFLFRGFLAGIHIAHVFILGILIGAIAQIGDLSESLIKRDCQVKDSGLLFPGLGGILDLTDSLTFAIPTFYFYLKIIS